MYFLKDLLNSYLGGDTLTFSKVYEIVIFPILFYSSDDFHFFHSKVKL